jgi:EmrB/QacA subfamily drug resistance transporter
MNRTELEHKYIVFLVCVTGIFITVFDTSSSIVALPTIALEFGTDLVTAQWVIAGNSLTIAAVLVPMGRLSDVVGRKRIYVVGAVIFALGAMFAASSESIYGLIGARVLVGIGSAMTQAAGTAILVTSFGAAERAKMLGLQLGAVGLGSIVGPASGGIIVGTLGWRVLFAITAATMVAIAVVSQRTLRRRTREQKRAQPAFDYAGALLSAAFLVAVLLTLTLGPSFGWLEWKTLSGAAVAALLLVAFIAVERRTAAPMLDLALFRRAEFALGALTALVAYMGISAIRFLVPFFLQNVRGFSAESVGLTIVPAAIMTAIAAPFAGRFADRFGVRLFANIGLGVTILGFLAFARLEVATPISFLILGMMVMSLGMAVFGAPNSAAILNSVEVEAQGATAGFVNLCRNSGNVIGIAAATVVVTSAMATAGYAPSLVAVAPSADPGILAAFTHGVDLTATLLALVAGATLVLVVARGSR